MYLNPRLYLHPDGGTKNKTLGPRLSRYLPTNYPLWYAPNRPWSTVVFAMLCWDRLERETQKDPWSHVEAFDPLSCILRRDSSYRDLLSTTFPGQAALACWPKWGSGNGASAYSHSGIFCKYSYRYVYYKVQNQHQIPGSPMYLVTEWDSQRKDIYSVQEQGF